MTKPQPKKIRKKRKSHNNKVRIILVWTLIFFVLTYSVLNQSTLGEQLSVLYSSIKVFSGATIQVLTNQKIETEINSETYKIEKEVHRLINQIRIENGLNKLDWDPFLGKLAREHSIDMASNKYFNHTDLLGQDPTKRAKMIGIRTKIITEKKIYIGVSENIGIMPRGIVQDVGILITTNDIAAGMVFSWMNSPPHKKNILEKELFFSGVGVAYDGNDKYYLTQNFQ